MTQSINELKSYTEYNVSTPTSVFTIGFQYEYNVDQVNVYVDDVEATAAGYTVQHDSQGTVSLTPAVPSGVVRLARETNIDTLAHTFSAGAKFTAGNMDENFQQIRHAQQEVNDNFSSLSASTSVRLDSFSDRVDNLNTEFLTTQDVVSDLVTISADTVNTANTALSTANAIDAKASTALSNSSTALSTAQGIDAKATNALDNSLDAVLDAAAALSTANAIDAKATQALTDSAAALSSATTALNTANAIDAKATQALDDSAAALTVSSGALKSSNNLSDVASATTARANLGVMSSSEVATAIATSVPQASETTNGVIELATQAEVNTGTDDVRAVTPKKMLVGVKNHLNASGNAPMYACRAWVHFNGTGTVTIRSSGNVSSIADNGIGDYTVNLTIPLQDQNYSIVATIDQSSGNTDLFVCGIISISTSNVRIGCRTGNKDFTSNVDSSILSVAVFR